MLWEVIRTCALTVLMLARLEGCVMASDTVFARVRSTQPEIQSAIREARARSSTFRTLVQAIERTDGIVYVEYGICGHGVRGCLLASIVTTAGFRFLRILVDASKSRSELMASIGHELQHAIEVLSNPTIVSARAFYQFYIQIAPTTQAAFETNAAISAGLAIAGEIARSPHVTFLQDRVRGDD